MASPLIRFATAQDGIDAEARLLALGQPDVLVWQAQAQALAMPWHFSRKPGYEAAARAAAQAGWPVALRPTGGGTVPQGPGVLNLAMVWPAARDLSIEAAYQQLCAPMVAALAGLGLTAVPGATQDSFCDGTYNLSVEGRKIVGTAQRWRAKDGQRCVLGHALILIEPPKPEAIRAIDALQRQLDLGLHLRAEVHDGLCALLAPTAFALEPFAQDLSTRARQLVHQLARA